MARVEANHDRSTTEVVRAIATDTAMLVRKEVELARQEIVEGVMAKVKGSGALCGALALGLLAVAFAGVALGFALTRVVDVALAWLIVAGVFALLAGVAGLVGRRLVRSATVMPDKALHTMKEDVEWAKAQLTR